MLDAVLARADANLEGSLDRLSALIRIPSISTDAAYAAECAKAAEWCRMELAAIGFEASVRPTAGRPMVVGHRTDAGAKGPRVLFYGHYDVQPVDPLSLWKTDPFEPTLLTRPDGSREIVARGTSDDKGQLLTFVEACRAWIKATGSLPVPVSVLFEGEEESGSPSLETPSSTPMPRTSHGRFALVCDTSMFDADTPAISISPARPRRRGDRHQAPPTRTCTPATSAAPRANPIHMLSDILAQLHDADNRVTARRLLRRRRGAAAGRSSRAVGVAAVLGGEASSAASACRIPATERGRSGAGG
jgi:acetylornithine deacetylase/succinyl-diaminopimelate desuccinylase-like protein